MNLTFGGILGGGLHLGAGFIGDRISGRAAAGPQARAFDDILPEHQATIIAKAADDIGSGRAVDVAPLFDEAKAAVEARRSADGTAVDPVPPGVTVGDALKVTSDTAAGRALDSAPSPKLTKEQRRELASRQGYERLRLATAKHRKRVVLLCKVPIPGLPVDRLVTMQELAPGRLEAAIAEAAQRGGVLRLSAAGLAQDAPETFTTEKAAARWLESPEGKQAFNPPVPVIRYTISGQGVLNPVRVRLKVQGQRGPRPTPALVIVPGNPRDIAEARLGPLAMFELVDDAPPKMLENSVQVDCPPLAPIAESSETEPDTSAECRRSAQFKRLVILPPEERLQSPILARYILERRSIRLGKRIPAAIAGAAAPRFQQPPGAAWV
jgi:hypothetical protein